MKKILLIFAMLMIGLVTMAQDRIVMKDGSVILGRVQAINDQDLHYCSIVLDEAGNYYVDEHIVRVVPLNMVESATHSSGRQLYPIVKPEPKPSVSIEHSPYINPQYKNPALAYLFSTVPGCGQFYNDQIGKGFGFVAASIAEGLIFTLSYSSITKTVTRSSYDSYTNQTHYYDEEVTDHAAVGGAILSGIALFVTYIWSSIDAVTTANKLNIANGYVIKASPTLSHNTSVPTCGSNFMAGMSLSLSF